MTGKLNSKPKTPLNKYIISAYLLRGICRFSVWWNFKFWIPNDDSKFIIPFKFAWKKTLFGRQIWNFNLKCFQTVHFKIFERSPCEHIRNDRQAKFKARNSYKQTHPQASKWKPFSKQWHQVKLNAQLFIHHTTEIKIRILSFPLLLSLRYQT